MFLLTHLLVGFTFFFFLLAQFLAFPLEDADDALFLHARKVITATNTLITANNTSATATTTDVGDEVAENILAAVTKIGSAPQEANLAIVGPGTGTGLVQLESELSPSSTFVAATTTQAVGLSVITITIVQPSLCSVSDIQYSTKTAIPTGQVQIFPDQNAYWGTTGSIWNFTLDDAVGFSSLTASCQGSICTGTQAEMSGSIVKNPDGVWTLNVTAKMQQAITVFGVTSGGDPVNGKFDLTITSTPPCALPIAQSCASSSFNPSASQWQAYGTDKWLVKYISTNNIQTFADLYNQAIVDFIEPKEYANFHCDPGDEIYSCQPPTSPADCNSTQGFLVVWGVMRISNALDFLWNTLTRVQGDVENWLASLIVDWVVPSVTQKWENYVTAASSIVGVLVFIFILIDVLSEDAASPLTGIAVALIVGTTNIIGAVANFANGFTTTPPSDTYLEYVGEYGDFDSTWIGYMQSAITDLWTPTSGTSFGATAVENGLLGGAWTNVLDPFSTMNLDTVTRLFFDTILLDSLINQIWKTNGFYVVFVPYGSVSNFEKSPGSSTTTIPFGLDDCNNHWANDPARTDYIDCSLNYGGVEGMTILTQPFSIGGTVKDILQNFTAPAVNYTFSNEYALQSSLTANALYGFEYNLTTAELDATVKSGAYNLTAEYVIPPDTAGLFNLDVCVVTQLSYVPGAREYLDAGNGDLTLINYEDPCSCATFSSQGMNFVDYATAAVVDAVSSNQTSGQPCSARYVPQLPDPWSYPFKRG